MKQNILSFFSLAFLLLCGVNVNAQCGDSLESFCYAPGDAATEVLLATHCPDAGASLNIEFLDGDIETDWDQLFVHSGTASDLTDAQIAGPIDGSLAGLAFSSANPGECLTFGIISDGSVACSTGQLPSANYAVSCDPIVFGCTNAEADNLNAGANFEDGSCTFAADFNQTINDVVMVTDCGPGNIFDSGGSADDYMNDENTITTICPTDATTQLVQLDFTSFNMENNFDFVNLFDGTDITAPSLGTFTGTTSPGVITASSTSGCVTIQLTSDGSVTAAGFSALFSCVARPMCAAPFNGVADNITFDAADLTWTSNNTNDGDNTFSVYVGFPPADPTTGTGTTTTGLTDPELALTGLPSNTEHVFYIMENCMGTDGDSGWSGPFFFTTAPNFCGPDQFTDPGGVDGNYPNNAVANGLAETIICPTGDPNCEKVTVSFNSFETEDTWDGLFIFDADSQDPAALIDSGADAGNGGLAAGAFQGTNSPGTITATNDTGCLTFFFFSDSFRTFSGWDADVICSIPPIVTNDQSTAATEVCVDITTAPNIFDPCTCNIPTELLDGVVTTLGNFNEELDVFGVVAGATWDVTAGTGLNAPVGADGDAVIDVNANGILDAGDMITDANNDGDIQITGTHDDGVGYDVTITDGVFVLSEANLCNQPRPDVTNLPASYCTNALPLTLEAIDALGSTEESVTFEIGGAVVTELDPAALGAGNFELIVTFNGDNPPGSGAPDTVGCPVISTFSVTILEGPTALSCNDNVQVSLDDACSATITPDVILEGADGCDESFSVSVMNNLGADLGDVVDGSFVGAGEFTVRVIELSTGNFCWGSIVVEDKIAPTVDCEPISVVCTDEVDPSDTTPREFTLTEGVPVGATFPAGTTDFPIEVAVPDAAATVSDLNVVINLIHPTLNNLEITLTSPTGTVSSLFNTTGVNFAGCGGDLNFIADDEGRPADLFCNFFQDGLATDAAGFFSMGGPQVFEGEALNGTWTLSIINSGGTTGLINELSLNTPFTSNAANEFTPASADNCSVPTLTFNDLTETGDCAGPSATTTRTWTATDASGNTAQCDQIITFERPSLADINIPADVTIDCADYTANNDAVAPTINGAGEPTINGLPIVNGSICNISATLASEIIIEDICSNTFKIRREWLVVDWCAADGTNNEIFQIQYVKVLDSTGPAVLGGTDQLAAVIGTTIASDNGGAEHEICEGFVNLPALTWADDCGAVSTYTTSVFALDGSLLATVTTNGGSLPNIPLYSSTSSQPEYQAVYTATDDCGNTSTYTENFQTEDRVSPVCVLDEITQIAIGHTNYNPQTDDSFDAYINASVFDDGSYDNCNDVHFLIDRPIFPGDADADGGLRFYSENEVFDCSDIGEDNMVFVMVLDDWLWERLNNPSQSPTYIANGIPEFPQGLLPYNPAFPDAPNTDIEWPDGLPFYNQFAPELSQYLSGSQLVNFAGHYNICMVQVLVEDKLAPVKIADVTDPAPIACDDYFTNYAPALDIALANGDNNPQMLIDAFGDVVYEDNCEAIVTTSWSYDVNSCGVGTITRNWSATDPSGNDTPTCSQTISIYHVNDWSIEFPQDVDLNCAAGQDELAGEDFGEPVVYDDNCELIAISVDDVTYDVVPDACYKVIRTYTAINWCVYDGDNLNDDRLRSTTAAVSTLPGGTNSPTFEDGGNDSNSGNAQSDLYTDVENFNTSNDDGIVVYQQVIKVNDDVAPAITNPGTQEYCIDGSTDGDGDCDRSIELPEAEVVECSENVTTTYAVAGLGTGRNYSNVAPGTYTVTVTSVDNCGNQSSIEYDVVVRDCKAPTPYCVGGLVVELMPIDNNGDGQPDAGMVELWASDFNAGSFDNCTATADLTVLASLTNAGVGSATANISFDCSNVGPNGVYLYIQDEAGNSDYCLTTVYIESVDNVCNGTGGPDELTIAGALATENGAALATASVSLNNGTSTISDADGAYALMAEMGTDVTVIPEHDVYDNTSVTTFDLLVIRQHILTTSLLDSPYKMIAADINNNGAITASDLVAARQVILGMATSYPNNNAWAFVDAAYEFPTNWTLTDGYPAVTNFNNIAANETANFVAVRIGDVNGTFGFADSADERNSMIINANDATLVAGQEVTVEFSAADAVLGYQFTLNFNKLEVVSIDGKDENFGVFANAITTSFDTEASDRLFSVTFKATADVTLSEAIALTSNITKAEAYSTNGAMNIALEFVGSTSADFALYQNTPNPFQGQTVIGFNLPTASAATLTISDVSGKVLSITKGEYTKGYNEVRVSDLGATGVLYYQLDTQNDSAVRKMVVID